MLLEKYRSLFSIHRSHVYSVCATSHSITHFTISIIFNIKQLVSNSLLSDIYLAVLLNAS